MKNRRITQIFLFIAMISALTVCFVVGASALEPTGQCGDNVYYTYDGETGKVVISGTGAMYDYDGGIFSDFCDDNITSVVVEDGVTSIGACAFYHCTSLNSITIPDSVTSIGNCAFDHCYNLTSITIPDSVTSIGIGVFADTEWYDAQPDGDVYAGTVYYQYKGTMPSNTSVVIKAGTKGIAGGAFKNCTNLTSITIPDSVTSIGFWAFGSCTSLTSITIPDSVTSIGDSAFESCTSLTSITIPDSVTSIDGSAFENCDSLTSIKIPDSVTSIGDWVFAYCSSLTSITIPDSVTSIGDYAFRECANLTSITVDSDNEYYSSDGYGVLFNKDKTTLIQYPIGNSRSLYLIPDSVTSIGDYAFRDCRSLTSITIPDSVTSIGGSAFAYCSNLTSITIPDSVTSIGGLAFRGCSSLTSITIPDSVTSIGKYAFDGGFDSLTDVYYTGTEAQWNAIEIDEGNASLYNATIHFNSIAHTHTPKTITIPATCTVNGMSYTICETCGETIGEPTILPAAHTPGEWETVQEPTITAEGKKILRCTVCGEIIEEVAIPMLQVVSDKGIDLAFPADNYDGEVDVTVEESFDGTAFDIIDTSANTSQKVIYDIKMILNGEEIQPNSKVTIRIPLPAGYDPTRSFVYHVNTVTGKVEKMDARYEDGYLVFETDHFSYYAVLEIAEANPSDTCTCNCHKGGIVGFFFRLFNFFQKLFGQNKICACGAKH